MEISSGLAIAIFAASTARFSPSLLTHNADPALDNHLHVRKVINQSKGVIISNPDALTQNVVNNLDIKKRVSCDNLTRSFGIIMVSV